MPLTDLPDWECNCTTNKFSATAMFILLLVYDRTPRLSGNAFWGIVTWTLRLRNHLESARAMCDTKHEDTRGGDVLGPVLFALQCMRKTRQLLSATLLNRIWESLKKFLDAELHFIIKAIGLLSTLVRKPAIMIPRFTHKSTTEWKTDKTSDLNIT